MPSWLSRDLNLPLALAAAGLVLYGALFANAYEQRVLTVAGIYALLAIGYHFIFGQAGALSLAQGAFFGLGAYVTGILGARYGVPFGLTFTLALAVPVAVAAVIALPVLRLASHYLALATLGIAQVVLLVAINWETVTGGANGIPGVPGIVLFGTPLGRGLPILAFVWAVVAVGALAAWQLTRGHLRLAFAQMRADEIGARSLGVDTARLRLIAFLLSAAYGGVAGALYVHTIGVISPEALEFPVMVVCLTMAVVGGRTRVSGAVLGAVLLIHLPEWLRFLERGYLIAYGAALLGMIVVAPDGLIGRLSWLRRRLWPEVRPPLPQPLPLAVRQGPTRGASVLEIDGLGKSFGGLAAVDDVTLSVRAGEVVGLIGPNGSGKTTLLNLVTGVERPDRGRIACAGRDITDAGAVAVARGGIARTYQNAPILPDVSVLESVATARCGGPDAGFLTALSGGVGPLRRAEREAVTILDDLGLMDIAHLPAATLTHGQRRQVDLARALALQPTLLLLDEPAAGLSAAEQAVLAGRLRALARAGTTVLVVDHNMPFLLPLADRLLCLDAGRLIAEGSPDAVRCDPGVVEAYLGTAAETAP